jgi:hypothetical protein
MADASGDRRRDQVFAAQRRRLHARTLRVVGDRDHLLNRRRGTHRWRRIAVLGPYCGFRGDDSRRKVSNGRSVWSHVSRWACA